MKKYLLIVLLMACLVIPASSTAWNLAIMGGGVEEAAEENPYDCGNNYQVFGWPCEDPTVDDSGESPVGCTDLGDNEATGNVNCSISGTIYSDGDESCRVAATPGSYALDMDTDFSSSEGVLWMDVCTCDSYAEGGGAYLLLLRASTDPTNDYIKVIFNSTGETGAADVSVAYKGAGEGEDVIQTDSNWDETSGCIRIKYEWKTAASNADHKLTVYSLDSSSPRQISSTLDTVGPEDEITTHDSTIDEMLLGPQAAGPTCYYDRILIYCGAGSSSL